LFLAGRLVDVEWGGEGFRGLESNVNHFVDKGYEMQIFIDNVGRNPMAVKTLRIDFWRGNASVYGLVNPVIP
jgi:hypothetical protein